MKIDRLKGNDQRQAKQAASRRPDDLSQSHLDKAFKEKL